MDALEKMKETILQEAQLKVNEIVEAATRDADAILQEAGAEAARKREEELAEAREKAQENARRITTLADLDARRQLLAAKEELVKEAFSSAKKRLEQLEPEVYNRYLNQALFDAAGDSGGAVIMSERDRSGIGKKIVSEVNAELAKAGRKGKVQLADISGDFIGGFVLSSGKVEVNCTFDAILAREYEALLVDVARILFG
jgi:V/A-type H+-transporting ATPase subunit E